MNRKAPEMRDQTNAILGERREEFQESLPDQPAIWSVDRTWSDQLLPLEEVNSLLRSGALPVPLLELVQRGQLISPTSFTLGQDIWSRNLPDVRKVDSYVKGGATMVLNLLHDLDITAAQVARDLQDDFHTSVTGTAFYTPAETHGFNFHYDSYGAFLVQLAGTKIWRVAPPLVAEPLESQRWNPALATPERISNWQSSAKEFELNAGQVLWLPRGWIHGGRTATRPSWHVTFGLAEYSYVRILRLLLARAEIHMRPMREDIYGGWAREVDISKSVDHAVSALIDWLPDCGLHELAVDVETDFRSQLFTDRGNLSIADAKE